MYCLRYIQGPDSLNEIEVDHIIPQASFETSSIKNHEVIQHNLLNLGLLPKNENASKNKKRLIMIESEWLRDQIEKYEFIPKDCFADFSDVKNYKEMFELNYPLRIDCAMEAKCYSENHSVGVREMSRLISRIRYRQFGVLITTSYVHDQAYKEVMEDGHPILIMSATDIASVLRKNAIISSNIEDWFTILDNTDGRGFADRMKAYYDKIETI